MKQQQLTTDPAVSGHATTEISYKSIFLSILLVILLGASNAFLGLKVGTTIAASIPAVVMAMGFFRLFRRYSTLEINMVQTAAAAGEGVAGGMIFSIPALIIMHYWVEFHYWETAIIGMIGGILGVLFSIFFRRTLLKDKTLHFPEGTAIGEVMKASVGNTGSLMPMMLGGLVGAIIGLFQTGFRILAQGYEYWVMKGGAVFGFNLGFSPAVIAAGYICGITAAISIFVGVTLGWIIGVPLISHHFGIPIGLSASDTAQYMWVQYSRYMGVGTMLIGGLWTLIKLFKTVIKGVQASLDAWQANRQGESKTVLSIDRDVPWRYVLTGIFLLLFLVLIVFSVIFSADQLGISKHLFGLVLVISTIYLLVAGLIFSSVSGYFAGLVGSTNSPGSGLMVSFLLGLCLLLFLLLASHINFSTHSIESQSVAALAIMMVAFVGSALSLVSTSIQVAKAGSMVGGIPWKQQMTLIGSVILAALVVPMVLKLLFNAYGIGGVFPHPGMDPSQTLSAPQAGLMAAVAQGVFNHQIPWPMFEIGIMIAIVGIVVDEILRARYGLRLPVLAIGLGIYLRLEVTVPLIIGGVISYLVTRKTAKRIATEDKKKNQMSSGTQNALMLACGLVAGSTLMGVFLAIPFAIKQSADVFRLVPDSFIQTAGVLSIIVTLCICYWMYKVGTKKS